MKLKEQLSQLSLGVAVCAGLFTSSAGWAQGFDAQIVENLQQHWADDQQAAPSLDGYNQLTPGQTRAWQEALWEGYRQVQLDSGMQQDVLDQVCRITFPGRGEVVMNYVLMSKTDPAEWGMTASNTVEGNWGGEPVTLYYIDPASLFEADATVKLPITYSMHGGGDSGGRGPAMNDGQYRNQQLLLSRYLNDGIYLVPRAPIDGGQMWHSDYMYPMWDRLTQQMVATGVVDANRVYIMGYSEGGYCTCRVGPNMADRWAAVGTSAAAERVGSSPMENLRNTPYILQVGVHDNGFDRIGMGRENGQRMAGFQADDAEGYVSEFVFHEGRGHGIDDRSTGPWLMQHTRNPYPSRIVWRQSGPVTTRAYWLAWDHPYGGEKPDNWLNRDEVIIAEQTRNTFDITTQGSIEKVYVRLNEDMIDFTQPVVIHVNGEEVFNGQVQRNLATLVKTLEEVGDPHYLFSAEVAVDVP